MKKNKLIAIITLIAAVLTAVSVGMTASAAGSFQYDGFAEYGQITHYVHADLDGAVLDGVISEGEYDCEPIKLTPSSHGVYFSDWTDNDLSDSFLKDILPESMTYYVTYNKDGLFIAAEIVDPHHYGDCGNEATSLWGVDSLSVDISIDAFGDADNGTYTQELMLDRNRVNYGLIEDSTGKLVNASYCYPVASYGIYYELDGVDYDSYEIRRDESKNTTTYEMFFSWFDLWLEDMVPERIFMNFQLNIADERYVDLAADGYIACLGGLRYSCMLPDEVMQENGYGSSSIYHVYELVDPVYDDIDEILTENTTESVEIETENADETDPESETEAATDTFDSESTSYEDTTETERDENVTSEPEKEEPVESADTDKTAVDGDGEKASGCGASIGAASVVSITACCVCVTYIAKSRKKTR